MTEQTPKEKLTEQGHVLFIDRECDFTERFKKGTQFVLANDFHSLLKMYNNLENNLFEKITVPYTKAKLQEQARQIELRIQNSSFIEHLTELQIKELEECIKVKQ